MKHSRIARPVGGLATKIVLATLAACLATTVVWADDPDEEVKSLRREVLELRRRDEERSAQMAEMERLLHQVLKNQGATPEASNVGTVPTVSEAGATSSRTGDYAPNPPVTASKAADPTAAVDSPEDALDKALAGAGPSTPTASTSTDLWSAPIAGGAATVRLVDLSMDVLVGAGGSSVGNTELGELQGGAHDPNQNGFTLQQAELSLAGAVDPYFTGEAHIVGVVDGVEVEEAFLATSSLPYGLQVEAGYSLAEFGLINPVHAHAWDWQDQPVINTRMFGGEGTRSAGVRAAWLLPTPFFSELHVGLQNANAGGFTPSFIGDQGVGGRPNLARDVRGLDDLLWLVRSNSSWDLNSETALLLGASALYGPNATGPDGQTWIYGIDAKIRWRPATNFRGWPFVIWQTEAIGRSYKADAFVAGTDVDPSSGDFPNDLPGTTLHDGGFYTQLLYGFRYGWAAGLRTEYATGSDDSVEDGVLAPRSGDSTRGNRLRLSPLLTWWPSEFSRLRLQYNYDDADFLSGSSSAHTIWVGAEVLYGDHGAHKY